MGVYDIDLDRLDGTPGVLADQTGNVTLVVNVASRCGLTPQYEQLQALQERFGESNFTVLGVPCNQFRDQEPGGTRGDRHVLPAELRRHLPAAREAERQGRRAAVAALQVAGRSHRQAPGLELLQVPRRQGWPADRVLLLEHRARLGRAQAGDRSGAGQV